MEQDDTLDDVSPNPRRTRDGVDEQQAARLGWRSMYVGDRKATKKKKKKKNTMPSQLHAHIHTATCNTRSALHGVVHRCS
mmetsp:Transcript_2736/g.5210  ORF Transcript_2736/g.5210 Transcript_2736/m.5210 type:complete len:80 (+) Transcript_2736:353-592(+)